MPKHCITKRQLECLALAELKQRGCYEVVAVEIEYTLRGGKSNWQICTIDFGDARIISHPGHAIEATHETLWQQYDLMMDS